MHHWVMHHCTFCHWSFWKGTLRQRLLIFVFVILFFRFTFLFICIFFIISLFWLLLFVILFILRWLYWWQISIIHIVIIVIPECTISIQHTSSLSFIIFTLHHFIPLHRVHIAITYKIMWLSTISILYTGSIHSYTIIVSIPSTMNPTCCSIRYCRAHTLQ